jgi:hypothetical protein
MSDLGHLRASLARAQRELDAAHERLDALESSQSGPTKTALVPRVIERQRRQLILVGACSSAATAILLGLGALVFSKPPPAPAPPPIVASPLPPAPTAPEIPPPPPLASIAVPEPPPVVVMDPPRPPRRVSPPLAVKEEAPKRAHPDDVENGSLTVICLPVKCDSIVDNGTAIGPGHIFNRPVPVGRHSLVLHGANGVTKNVRVEIHADQLKEVRVMMQDVSEVF